MKILATMSLMLNIALCTMSILCLCMYVDTDPLKTTLSMIGMCSGIGFIIATFALASDEFGCCGCCCDGEYRTGILGFLEYGSNDV